MLDKKVLLLNQNYEPFAVCSAQKAVVLLYLHKVELVEHYPSSIRWVSGEMPYPSVIRLIRYIHKPYLKVLLNRRNILKRDKHICQYCGKNSQPMTVDHVIPKSEGGGEEWENLITACLACNNKKGNHTPDQAGMKLLKRPEKPSPLFFLQAVIGRPHVSWKPYLFMN